MLKLARWYNEVEKSGFKSFSVILRTFTQHYNEILNYFNNRSANASAENFNAKIKKFRSNFRGIKVKVFFLNRLQKILNGCLIEMPICSKISIGINLAIFKNTKATLVLRQLSHS